MIRLTGVKKSYGKGENKNQVLKGIDLCVQEGEFVVVTGASGSGKSTLLNVASGLERAEAGSVEYDGRDIETLSELVKGNAESLALLKAFGYTGRERCFSVFGGYLPFSAIGFAVGTLYQWGLLKIMITFVFREMEEVPAYTFDVKGLFLSLAAFVAVYGVILWWYILKAQRASLKVVMSEI